ncbi:MAG: hypothetical protein WCO71_02880 [Pseudomonadota bacterium]
MSWVVDAGIYSVGNSGDFCPDWVFLSSGISGLSKISGKMRSADVKSRFRVIQEIDNTGKENQHIPRW